MNKDLAADQKREVFTPIWVLAVGIPLCGIGALIAWGYFGSFAGVLWSAGAFGMGVLSEASWRKAHG